MPQTPNSVVSLPPILSYQTPPNTVIATGGTSQVVFAGTANGGYVTNPTNATELLYINTTGPATQTEALSNFALRAGQTFTVGRTAGNVSVSAATTGHVFCAVQF